eukprot:TRINITY_DN15506_c0_g1_i1.p1 TRINITY_DN15506_c0_g1~~TRINITY_DN15506_c0_g1_i1.p1  ORF type:complete len:1446 (-),score=180.93 TRINITY_DN15506_c0_g1_i1:70-4407(-)
MEEEWSNLAKTEAVALIATVVMISGRRFLEIWRLTPRDYDGPQGSFEYLHKALLRRDVVANHELSDDAIPANMQPLPNGFIAFFEGAVPVIWTLGTAPATATPDSVGAFCSCDTPMSANTFARRLAYTYVGAAAQDGRAVALFSKAVDLFRFLPTSSGPGASMVYRHTWSIPADADGEFTSGAFHPKHPNLLLFVREGELCAVDVTTEICWDLSRFSLSRLELARKAHDGDDIQDVSPSGPQLIYFSPSGRYLVRHNAFYGSFGLYSWRDIAAVIQRILSSTTLGHRPYAILPANLDPTMLVRRPTRKEELRGYLRRLHGKTRDVYLQLSTAIKHGLIGPNFAAAGGLTALHLATYNDEDMRRAGWLLEYGASTVVCEFSGRRPIAGLPRDLLQSYVSIADSKLPAEWEDGHIAADWALGYPCTDIRASRTALGVVYLLRAVEVEDPLFSLKIDAREGDTEVLVCDLATRSVHRLYVFDGTVWPDGVSFTVLPPLPQRWFALDPQKPGDCLLFSTGLLMWVEHGSPPRIDACVSAMLHPIVVERVADARARALDAGWCAFAWEEALTQPGAAQAAGNEVFASDMLGAACVTGHGAKPGEVQTLRLPRISINTDLSPCRAVAALINLASPAEKQVNVAQPEAAQLGQQSAYVVECGGIFLVVAQGRRPSAITRRGAVIELNPLPAPEQPLSERAVPVQPQAPSPHPVRSVVASYVGGVRWLAVCTSCGMDVFKVAGLPTDAELQALDQDLLSTTSHCLLQFRITHPESDEPVAACFHPLRRESLVFMRGAELLVLDVATLICCTLGWVCLEGEELRRKAYDSDAGDERIVGEQTLGFSADGRWLYRHNQFLRRVVLYDWRPLFDRLERLGRSPEVYINAFHLGLPATGAPRLRISGPENSVQAKEKTVGYLRRLSSKWCGVSEQRRHLGLCLAALAAGFIYPNFADLDGRTPMHLACALAEYESPEECHRSLFSLLRLGGNLYLCDSAGVRPLDLLDMPRTTHSTAPAIRALLAYRAHHYPFPAAQHPTHPTSAPSFPKCQPIFELTRACVVSQPATVLSATVYCLAVDGELFAANLRSHSTRSLTNTTDLGAGFVSFPFCGADAIVGAGGGVCVIRCDPDIHVETGTCLVHFGPAAALGEVHCSAVCGEENEVFITLVTVTGDVLSLRIPIPVPFPPGQELLRTLTRLLDVAWREATNLGPPPQIGTLESAACSAISFGRRLAGRATEAGRVLEALLRLRGTSSIVSVEGFSGTGSAIEADLPPTPPLVAAFSQGVHVAEWLPSGQAEGAAMAPRDIFFLAGESEETPAFGCFHPAESHLLLFFHAQQWWAFNYVDRSCRAWCGMMPGSDEAEICDSEQAIGRHRVYSCGTEFLVRHNLDAERLLVYRWADLEALAESLGRDPDGTDAIVNNCVLLPPSLGNADTLTVATDMALDWTDAVIPVAV